VNKKRKRAGVHPVVYIWRALRATYFAGIKEKNSIGSPAMQYCIQTEKSIHGPTGQRGHIRSNKRDEPGGKNSSGRGDVWRRLWRTPLHACHSFRPRCVIRMQISLPECVQITTALPAPYIFH